LTDRNDCIPFSERVIVRLKALNLKRLRSCNDKPCEGWAVIEDSGEIEKNGAK